MLIGSWLLRLTFGANRHQTRGAVLRTQVAASGWCHGPGYVTCRTYGRPAHFFCAQNTVYQGIGWAGGSSPIGLYLPRCRLEFRCPGRPIAGDPCFTLNTQRACSVIRWRVASPFDGCGPLSIDGLFVVTCGGYPHNCGRKSAGVAHTVVARQAIRVGLHTQGIRAHEYKVPTHLQRLVSWRRCLHAVTQHGGRFNWICMHNPHHCSANHQPCDQNEQVAQ